MGGRRVFGIKQASPVAEQGVNEESLSCQGCRCDEAAGIPVGWPKKKSHMVMQQVCTGKLLLQRSFFKPALVGLVFFFPPYLQLKFRHRFKVLPGIERTGSTALEITERPYLFLLSPARISGTPRKFLWYLRILQQQMAVERGTRFLLTGPSLELCSPEP